VHDLRWLISHDGFAKYRVIFILNQRCRLRKYNFHPAHSRKLFNDLSYISRIQGGKIHFLHERTWVSHLSVRHALHKSRFPEYPEYVPIFVDKVIYIGLSSSKSSHLRERREKHPCCRCDVWSSSLQHWRSLHSNERTSHIESRHLGSFFGACLVRR